MGRQFCIEIMLWGFGKIAVFRRNWLNFKLQDYKFLEELYCGEAFALHFFLIN